MKVSELIELLQCEDPDLEVVFSYNYGDYWRTEVAEDVEIVEPLLVKWSEYHRAWALTEDDEIDNEKTKEVLVLS